MTTGWKDRGRETQGACVATNQGRVDSFLPPVDKKIRGAVVMLDMPLFTGGRPLMPQAACLSSGKPLPV